MLPAAEKTAASPTCSSDCRWIPWCFVAFFVVIALADGIMVYLAVSTQTGVVADKTYDKGLRYNQTLQAARAQEALGWKMHLPDQLPQQGKLVMRWMDKAGKPLVGLQLRSTAVRPVQDGQDFPILWRENAPGEYIAEVHFSAVGQWDVEVQALHESVGQPYETVQRVMVRP